ncbi:alkaline phosphatase D family protein [Alcaligenes aquatilis]|uniref:alkaline phosphatase family protein n=1 Tax=Alcaligenes aquatilis TaxID=323284 RepID=UPI003D20E023
MTTNLLLGPVLSFRGASKGKWKVSALIGVDATAKPPKLIVDGKAAKSMVLLKHRDRQYLRYDLTMKQGEQERRVEYTVDGMDEVWHFTVPGKNYAARMAYVSCNGFSDPSSIRKLIKGEKAVWADLLCNHDKLLRPDGYMLDKEQLWHEARTHDKGLQRFHLLLMGGDQIYFDSIWEDVKELKGWIGLPRDQQLDFPVTPEIEAQIENYYLSLYATRWLPNERAAWGSETKTLDAAHAMARTPTVMMWDDHDIFDGWGSYSCEMQNSPLFKRLFHHARRAFWVFQMQHADDQLPELKLRDDVPVRANDPLFQKIEWSKALKKDPLALPMLDQQPGFSFVHAIGPIQLVVADLRTERSHQQVMGPDTWDALQAWLKTIPENDRQHPGTGCQHLLFMSSVPVVHPKLTLAEAFLDNFGSEHVLDSSADDLKDHWTHDDHEGERLRLLETLFATAKAKRLRVAIVSGDVHVAAHGVANRKDAGPQDNWAQIQQFTSTAVVHPSLVSVAERLFFHVLDGVGKITQDLDVNTSAKMLIFPQSNRRILAARNWLALELDIGSANAAGSKLWATWRCETKDGTTNHLVATQPTLLLDDTSART